MSSQTALMRDAGVEPSHRGGSSAGGSPGRMTRALVVVCLIRTLSIPGHGLSNGAALVVVMLSPHYLMGQHQRVDSLVQFRSSWSGMQLYSQGAYYAEYGLEVRASVTGEGLVEAFAR